MKRYVTSTLHHLSAIPENSIYRGNGQFDYEETGHAREALIQVKEKLAEYDDKFEEIFRKPGFKREVTAQKLKGGKDISNPGKGGRR